MTSAVTEAHLFPVVVEPTDIDFMGHVNNAIYLNWVQAAVISHWRHIADTSDVDNHLWVALKHEIRYRRPAFLGDKLIAVVVPEKLYGARAWYDTVIKRDGEVLAEVRSIWCCMDAAGQRPVRIRQNIRERFKPKGAGRFRAPMYGPDGQFPQPP